MTFADLLTVTEEGIRLPEASLSSVGIQDGSTCWGLWYGRPGEADDRHRALILSAVHPRAWPFLMRIRVYLRDEPGALEKACRFLDDNYLSILFGECSGAGSDYARLDVVAESISGSLELVKKQKEEFDRSNPWVRFAGAEFKRAQVLATHIARLMLIHLREVQLNLESSDIPLCRWVERDEDDVERIVSEMIDADELERSLAKQLHLFPGRDEVRQFLKLQMMRKFSARYMHRLLRYACFGGGSEVPLLFRYAAATGLLQADSRGTLSSDEAPWGATPCSAVAVFNTRDKYLRIDPAVSADSRERLTRVEVDYSANGATSDCPPAVPRGLLWRVCRAFAGSPQDQGRAGDEVLLASPTSGQPRYLLNMRKMSVKWTQDTGTRGSGRVTIIGNARPSTYRRLRANLIAIGSQRGALPCPEIHRAEVRDCSPPSNGGPTVGPRPVASQRELPSDQATARSLSIVEAGPFAFLSYSRRDAAIATRLVEQLKRDGLSVYKDTTDIEGGDSWADAIEGALASDNCRAVLLLASKNVNEAETHVKNELYRANNYHRPIIPALVDSSVSLVGGLAYLTSSNNPIVMAEAGWEDWVLRIEKALISKGILTTQA